MVSAEFRGMRAVLPGFVTRVTVQMMTQFMSQHRERGPGAGLLRNFREKLGIVDDDRLVSDHGGHRVLDGAGVDGVELRDAHLPRHVGHGPLVVTGGRLKL
jgi:hypothetical protein